MASRLSPGSTFGLAAKYAAMRFRKAPAFCSLPTTGSLLVFSHALMSTRSSVTVHFFLSLRSEGESSQKVEATVGSCDDPCSPPCEKLAYENVSGRGVSCWLTDSLKLWDHPSSPVDTPILLLLILIFASSHDSSMKTKLVSQYSSEPKFERREAVCLIKN